MSMSDLQIANARLILDDPGTSAIQSIQLENATGGSFTISFAGQTTSALAYNAGANVVQNALAALSTIGLGNVEVNVTPGTPGSVFYAIYFDGTLANVAQPMLTVNGSLLTGIGVLEIVSQVQAGGVAAFSDAELGSQYDLAKGNYFLAICYLFRILWAGGAKFNDYTAGQTQEKKSQVTAHLKELAEQYENWSRADRQVQMASLIPAPPRDRAIPWTPGSPAPNLTYNYRRSRWGGGWS